MNKKLIIIAILLIAILGLITYLIIQYIGNSKNPCYRYEDSDSNISRECILHVWNNIAGCPNTPSDIIDYYEQTSKPSGTSTINGTTVSGVNRTLASIISDAKAWASLPSTNHRTKCYGTDTSKWPAV